jgi:hypothetical protein
MWRMYQAMQLDFVKYAIACEPEVQNVNI